MQFDQDLRLQPSASVKLGGGVAAKPFAQSTRYTHELAGRFLLAVVLVSLLWLRGCDIYRYSWHHQTTGVRRALLCPCKPIVFHTTLARLIDRGHRSLLSVLSGGPATDFKVRAECRKMDEIEALRDFSGERACCTGPTQTAPDARDLAVSEGRAHHGLLL